MTHALIQNINDVLDTSRTDIKNLQQMFLKLVEEIGELAEAVNYKDGLLPNKTLTEEPFGEVADIMICTLSVLHRLYPDLSNKELVDHLAVHIKNKRDKWAKVMITRP